MPQLLGPLVGASEWVKSKVQRNPSPRRRLGFKLPSLNFIMWHCKPTNISGSAKWPSTNHTMYFADVYMVTMALVGSVLLYPAGGLSYVDALFFASGAATQSGLNT